MNNKYILGFDTSNYKTSVALIDEDYNIIYDARKFLKVKDGERGLRQSEALFQHIQNLPELIDNIPVDLDKNLAGVAWSSRPRPIEESYMPVFNAGSTIGKSISSINSIMGISFSHQEGHIESILHDTCFKSDEPFIACHFSGGTTEVNIVKPRPRGVVLNSGIFYKTFLAGGTRDISYGQVLDRAGVALGMPFPAGEYMDYSACNAKTSTDVLTPIKARNGYINLSGIDTQIKRVIESDAYGNERDNFIREIFEKLASSVEDVLYQVTTMTEITDVVMAGGVASSNYLRSYIANSDKLSHCNILFGSPELSQDNAVGIAILGGRYIWD